MVRWPGLRRQESVNSLRDAWGQSDRTTLSSTNLWTSDEVVPLRRARWGSRRHRVSSENTSGDEQNQGPNEQHPRQAQQHEDQFLHAAEVGDIPTVRRMLQENPELNVNCVDILGRTPLRLAVGNEHLEVVELLLDRSDLKNVYEALLQAISADHDEIAECILKHPKYEELSKESKKIGKRDFFFERGNEESQFASEITPLILAAQHNRFEIVLLLLMKGQTIEKPHKHDCGCMECKGKTEFDELRFAKSRLNAYRGLASEAYISLSSKDPILTAFELGQELRGVAKAEKYFKAEYMGLVDQLSQYVVKLLDRVRGNEELDLILNVGYDGTPQNSEKLARFKLALEYKEKRFVSHSSCQKKLTSIWYHKWKKLQQAHWLMRPFGLLVIILLYPVLAVLYFIVPKSQIGDLLRTPFIKFVAQTVSFVVFICMITSYSFSEKLLPGGINFSTQRPNISAHWTYYKVFLTNATCLNSNMDDDINGRSDWPGSLEIAICVWISGLLWQECKQIYGDGYQQHFSSLFNTIDFLMLCLYTTAFTLRYMVFFKAHHAYEYFSRAVSWQSLVENDTYSVYQCYWLVADRFYWDPWDPQNISEGLFAVANVLSFSRLSYLLAANEHLGPMQISLAKMIKDFAKFMVIFTFMMLAFLVGLHNLYWYYEPSVRGKVELADHQVNTPAEKGFGTVELTFRTVYWSLFGMAERTSVELGEQYGSQFTERVGYIIFGVYNWAAVILLLNMLIAMMTRSFDKIATDQDVEWKFARSQLYMDYIKDGSTLPVPFNIVPTPKTLFYLVKPLMCHFRKHKQDDASPTAWTQRRNGMASLKIGGALPTRNRRGFTKTMGMNGTPLELRADDTWRADQPLTYERVIKRVVKRYIFESQNDAPSNEGDIEELKQDVSSFRYEMLNSLKLQQESIIDSINLLSSRLIGQPTSMPAGGAEGLRSSPPSVPDIRDADTGFGATPSSSSQWRGHRHHHRPPGSTYAPILEADERTSQERLNELPVTGSTQQLYTPQRNQPDAIFHEHSEPVMPIPVSDYSSASLPHAVLSGDDILLEPTQLAPKPEPFTSQAQVAPPSPDYVQPQPVLSVPRPRINRTRHSSIPDYSDPYELQERPQRQDTRL